MAISESTDATLFALSHAHSPFSEHELGVINALRKKRARERSDGAPQPAPNAPKIAGLLANTLRHLPDAIISASLDDRAEFHSLFQFMVGLGLDHSELATKLGVGRFTISRYANGDSAPPMAASRRGILVDTYRFLCVKAEEEDLPYLSHHRDSATRITAANSDDDNALMLASETAEEA